MALPYFTALFGDEEYAEMLLAYNLGAMVCLAAQVGGGHRAPFWLAAPSLVTCWRKRAWQR
eukprot:COSAG01_NODE_12794_length_1684_cov_2.868139_2_plen_61_part_00